MKKLKLGFADTHDHLINFFASLLANRFDVEITNTNPEFLIFGDENFGTTNKQFSSKDVVKIFYTGENRRPENYDCNYAITFDHNYSPWHYRLPLFVIYMWALENIHNLDYGFYHLLQDNKPKPKTDFCSFVVSNPNSPERNEFFNLLSKYKKVDSGGKAFNNIGKTLEGEQSKIDFLSSRKFNICYESQSYPGYVTEKILHAFYAKTIPIYWGSPTIASDFNPNAFINMHKFDDVKKAIDFIELLDTNDNLYESVLNSEPFSDNVPRDYIILNNFLNWFDAVVYNRINMRQQ